MSLKEATQKERDEALLEIGNLVHEDVPVAKDEVGHTCTQPWLPCDAKSTFNVTRLVTPGHLPPRHQADNLLVKEVGVRRPLEPWMRSHPDLLELLGIVNLEAGAEAAGGRGYYLMGKGVLLNQVRRDQEGIHAV